MSALNGLGPMGRTSEEAHTALKAACQDLEAVFTQQLLSVMRESVEHDPLMERSQGEELFTQLLDEHLSSAATRAREGGIADALYRQLARHLSTETPS